MSKSATTLANELLEAEVGGLEELRIHEFTDDEAAHDDELTDRLHADFSAEFDRVQAELSGRYGAPSRTGQEDDEVIPLNGVFRSRCGKSVTGSFSRRLAHEDRGVPILLMLGTAEGDVA